MLKNGSCATRGCEPCQVGNQAALSGLSSVPRGSLFGVEVAVTVRRGIFEAWVYGSFRRIDQSAYAELRLVYRCVLFCLCIMPVWLFLHFRRRLYVGLQGFIPQVASG